MPTQDDTRDHFDNVPTKIELSQAAVLSVIRYVYSGRQPT